MSVVKSKYLVVTSMPSSFKLAVNSSGARDAPREIVRGVERELSRPWRLARTSHFRAAVMGLGPLSGKVREPWLSGAGSRRSVRLDRQVRVRARARARLSSAKLIAFLSGAWPAPGERGDPDPD